jgi:3-hydroxyacyl-CoA dehydrogenase
MTRVQSRCRHPERCLLGHPFNPPHLIPLVEVVGGERTSAAAIQQAMAFYGDIGKHAIHIRKEVKGHVANRLQAAIWREALHLLADGVASVADIDAAITYGPGLRWPIFGPHMTFALAGGTGGMPAFLAQFGPPLESWWQDLGQPSLTPELQQRLIAGVAEEAAGRSIADLAAERDRCLLAVLTALAAAKKG